MNLSKKRIFKIRKINWGYTMYSKRFHKIRNGIVLKVIKKDYPLKKKYSYPPGPGSVVNSLSAEWIKDSTYIFIEKEIPEYKELSEKDKKRIKINYNKEEYTFLIEMYLRKNKIYYPIDIIWILFY